MNDRLEDPYESNSNRPEGRRPKSRALGCIACGCFAPLVIAFLAIPAIQAAREAAWRSTCTNNFKFLGMAMHHYHDAYSVFPSAFVADADGKPIHSWRILALAHLTSCKWYDRYDFDSSWDSPGNLRWVKPFSTSRFECPRDTMLNPDHGVPYVMIIGEDTASPPGKWLSLADFEDPANTILVAEIADSDIFWAEPRDLEFDKMSFRINDPARPSISSHHPLGAHVMMADGSVHFLSNATDPDVVRALITRTAKDNPKPKGHKDRP
jgi:hypothetical protein